MADQAIDETLPVEPVTLDEALEWAGWKLDGHDGASVGRVEGVLVDAAGGEPAWLVVRMGRFGHFSAIPIEFTAAGVGRVWVPFPRDVIREAPRLEPGGALTRERELELCSHFHIPEGKGRAAAIADRPEGSETVTPASAQD